MDGWESRRKRGPGNDYCIVALGARGYVRALDVDTNHFLGNHPPFASVEARDGDGAWRPILAPSPLRPGSQNLFTVRDDGPFTHVRLILFPDGGVARFRVYGEVVPGDDATDRDAEVEAHIASDDVDLAAVRNGGKALACSDAFFGPMDNLLMPGRALNMGGGWETRRKRPAPGHDWILIRLGQPGRVRGIEIDTNHFKGNFPERCALFGVRAPEKAVTDLIGSFDRFEQIVAVDLSAHRRHFVTELASAGPFTHVRLDIFPDGGISRLRVFGRPDA